MLSRIIALLILAAILFFPGKFVYKKIQQGQQIDKAAKMAAKELEKNNCKFVSINPPKAKLKQSPKIQKAAKSDKVAKKLLNKPEKTKSTEISEQNDYTFFDYLSDLVTGSIDKKNEDAILKANSLSALSINQSSYKAAKETLHFFEEHAQVIEPTHSITEAGSTPVAYILAKVPTPIAGLSYELNAVEPLGPNVRLMWKIKNETGREIVLTENIKHLLSPSKARIQDFSFQNALSIAWYNDNTSISNCMLSDSIPAFGRVECSAIFGPLFDGNETLMNQKVRIRLPGSPRSLNIYLNV